MASSSGHPCRRARIALTKNLDRSAISCSHWYSATVLCRRLVFSTGSPRSMAWSSDLTHSACHRFCRASWVRRQPRRALGCSCALKPRACRSGRFRERVRRTRRRPRPRMFIDVKARAEHPANVLLGKHHGRSQRRRHLRRLPRRSLVTKPLWRHPELAMKRDGGVLPQTGFLLLQMASMFLQQIGGWRRRESFGCSVKNERRTAVCPHVASQVDGANSGVRSDDRRASTVALRPHPVPDWPHMRLLLSDPLTPPGRRRRVSRCCVVGAPRSCGNQARTGKQDDRARARTSASCAATSAANTSPPASRRWCIGSPAPCSRRTSTATAPACSPRRSPTRTAGSARSTATATSPRPTNGSSPSTAPSASSSPASPSPRSTPRRTP